jgi:FlaA1/EpsC-like NDP-sugar epimerase
VKQRLKQLLARRRLCLLLIYTVGLAISLWLAYQLRFDFSVTPSYDQQLLSVLLWAIPLKLAFLLALGQFAGRLAIFGVPDLSRLSAAVGASSGFILLFRALDNPQNFPPRGVIAADFALSFVILGGLRLGLRMVWERLSWKTSQNGSPRRLGIIGAGDAGGSIARELLAKRQLGLKPVVFFDDDKETWHTRVHGIPVIGPPELLLCRSLPRETGFDRLFGGAPGALGGLGGLRGLLWPRITKLEINEIIIAMPSAPASRMGEVVQILRNAGLEFRTVPSLDQLATGAVDVSRVRPVQVQDLLGR